MDAADRVSVFVRHIRNDSYRIRNVGNCTCIIHRDRKIIVKNQARIKKKKKKKKNVIVGTSIRICPYLIGIKTVFIP